MHVPHSARLRYSVRFIVICHAENPCLRRPDEELYSAFYVHDLYQKSDYIKFLEDVGKENEKVAFYHDRFMQVGDISPTIVAFMMKEINEEDVMDERVRLMMAIHYLTLNEKNVERQKAKDRM